MKTVEESGSSLLAKTTEGEYVSVRSAEGLAVSPLIFRRSCDGQSDGGGSIWPSRRGHSCLQQRPGGTTFRDSKLGAEVIDSPPSPHLLLKKWQVIEEASCVLNASVCVCLRGSTGLVWAGRRRRQRSVLTAVHVIVCLILLYPLSNLPVLRIGSNTLGKLNITRDNTHNTC